MKKQTIKLGITGELCSGKSYICGLFNDLGIKSYNCDIRSKIIQNTNQKLRQEIIDNFGKDSYSYGEINAKYLSEIIFTDTSKKSKMMSIITPYLLSDFNNFYDMHKDESFILIESAILFETGWDEVMDYIIYVQVSESVRIKRCLKRDDMSPEEYKDRMKDQISSVTKCKKSDWILHNFTDKSKVSEVKKIYTEIIENIEYS